jgi:UDP-N-acetylglucosamine transferase subunit ALG13
MPVSVDTHFHNVRDEKAYFCILLYLGTGTILDAWKVGVPLIVVPNTELLDDHQTEMAKHLAREGYATHSNGTYVSLPFHSYHFISLSHV